MTNDLQTLDRLRDKHRQEYLTELEYASLFHLERLERQKPEYHRYWPRSAYQDVELFDSFLRGM